MAFQNNRNPKNEDRLNANQVPWLLVKEFFADEVAVGVWKQKGFRSKWSVQVGIRIAKQDGIRPFIIMRLNEDGTLARDTAELILDLVDQAQGYIKEAVARELFPARDRSSSAEVVVARRR